MSIAFTETCYLNVPINLMIAMRSWLSGEELRITKNLSGWLIVRRGPNLMMRQPGTQSRGLALHTWHP